MYLSINQMLIQHFTVYVYPFILVYYPNILEPRLEPL